MTHHHSPVLPSPCSHMNKVMRGVPDFKPGCGPFSDSHPFWRQFTLVPYDTPITVWRTPPGSAPGTLQAALNAAAVGGRSRSHYSVLHVILVEMSALTAAVLSSRS
jgi:hypothetical protein